MAESESSINVLFVKMPKAPKETSSLMDQAFEAVSEIGGKSLWCGPEECLQVKKRERHLVFVFSSFSGEAFEHVVSTANRIYGPSCILQCLKNGETLPRLNHPVFCKSMQQMVISCTNLSSELREDLHTKVTWMMGEASKDFHERVTHLIAGEVGSKKYVVAVNLKKKIMTPDWIQAVWQKSQSEFVNGSNSEFDKYCCPLFKGFVISVSGLESDERNRIKNLVEQEGGQYSGEMKINECTHLVVCMARGQKYEFARKWKIKIVKPDWIYESINLKYCLDENDFQVEQETGKTTTNDALKALTSTPTGQSLEGQTSILSNVSAISMTTVNETALQRRDSSSSSCVVSQQQQLKRRESSSSSSSKTNRDSVVALLDSIDLTNAKAGSFLDGCKIFVSGISSSSLEGVRKIINIGGGTRFNQINESISHVVMGEINEETVNKLRQATFRPLVVSIEWLVESFRQSKRLPEDLYACIDLPPVEFGSPPSKRRFLKKNSTTEDVQKNASSSVATASATTNAAVITTATTGRKRSLRDDDGKEEMQELLSQYMPSASAGGCSLGESTLIRAADVGEAIAMDMTKNKTTEDDVTLYVAPNDIEEKCEDEAGIFSGLKFVFFGFEQEDEEMFENLIKEHRGHVLPQTTRALPNYGVVPMFGCPVNVAVGEVATYAWLQICIESERVIPIDENIIFSPLPLFPNAQPLVGCVLSISGYSGTERDVLLDVSETLGAKCQEYFLRRAKAELLPSSHLVVNAPEGSKYKAAKKWNLPAVTKLWLFECAKIGKLVSVDKFLVDNDSTEVENVVPSNVLGGNDGNSKKLKCDADVGGESKTIAPTIAAAASAGPAAGIVFKEPVAPVVGGGGDGTGARRVLRSGFGSLSGDGNVPSNKVEEEPAACLSSREGRKSARNSTMATRNRSKPIDDCLLTAVVMNGSEISKDCLKRIEEQEVILLVKNSTLMTDICSSLSKKSSLPENDCLSDVGEDVSALAKDGLSESAKNIGSSVSTKDNLVGIKADAASTHQHPSSIFDDFVSVKPAAAAAGGKKLSCKAQNQKNKAAVVVFSNAADELLGPQMMPQVKTGPTDAQKGSASVAQTVTATLSASHVAAKLTPSSSETENKSSSDLRKRPKNNRLEKLINNDKCQPSPSLSTAAAAAAGIDADDTPSKFLTSEKYHLNLDLSGVLSPSISPAVTSKKSLRTSLPLEEVFAHNISIAVKNSASAWRKDDSFSQEAADNSCCLKMESAGPLKGVVIAVGKKLSRNQGDYNNIAASLGADYRWTYDNTCTHFIFQGRTNDTNKEFRLARDEGKFIISPFWLTACEEQKCRVDESIFPHTYNPSMSLNLTSNKTPVRPTRNVTRNNLANAARQPMPVAIASTTTSNGNDATAKKVDEETTIIRDDPRIVPSDQDAGRAAEKEDGDGFDSGDDDDMNRVCRMAEEKEKMAPHTTTLLDGIKRLNEASKMNCRGKQLTRILSAEKEAFDSSVESKNSRSSFGTNKDLDPVDESINKKTRTTPKVPVFVNTEPSQIVEVTWDDPVAREQREMLAHDNNNDDNIEKKSTSKRSLNETKSLEVVAVRSASEDEIKCEARSSSSALHPPPPPPPPPPLLPPPVLSLNDRAKKEKDNLMSNYVFLFSGLSPEDKDEFSKVIERLGGSALDAANYTSECTHLIVEKPMRNEKFLSCVAAGKWLLHKSYLTECGQKKTFVQEESYEWGNETNVALLSGLPVQSVKLAEAAHRWRLCLSSVAGGGAFDNWRVLLLTESRREDGFKRLLEAGGATVLSNKQPLNYSNATHAFIDISKLHFQINLEGFVRCGVHCLKPDYIANYLTDDPKPNPVQFYIPEIQQFLK